MKTIHELVKWGLKSIGGLIANLALLTVWVEYVGLNEAIAVIPNFVILSAVGYVVTGKYVFSDGLFPKSIAGHIRQYLGQQIFMIASKLLNYGIYLSLLSLMDYRLAWVVGAMVSFGFTFVMIRWWWQRNDSVQQT